MAADHFATVVNKYREGRKDAQIVREADIPSDWLTRPLKPSTRLRTMPDEGRIAALARAIGAPVEEVRAAFAADVSGTPIGATPIDHDDPQTRDLLRLWARLDSHHRGFLLSVTRSTATMQRKLHSGNDEIREVS